MKKGIKDFLVFVGQSLAFIASVMIFTVLFTLFFGIVKAIFQ